MIATAKGGSLNGQNVTLPDSSEPGYNHDVKEGDTTERYILSRLVEQEGYRLTFIGKLN